MTLALAWIRKIAGGTEELLVASDSRLGSGKRIDCCPKIILLPRSDCFICFAGDTDYAYPLMLQFSASIENYPRSKDRAMDLHDLRAYTLKVMNSMRDSVHFYAEGEEIPKTSFLFGGYSWIRKSFSIWNLHYKSGEQRFVYKPVGKSLGRCAFAGDWAKIARAKLITLLREQGKYPGNVELDMEPFEVLRDLLRSSTELDTIGGPPQLAKVYQHMNCKPIGVMWPDAKTGSPTILGRTLLGYEIPNAWVIDPDTFISSHALYSNITDE